MMGKERSCALLQYDQSSIVLVLFIGFLVYAYNLFYAHEVERALILYTAGPILFALNVIMFVPRFKHEKYFCFKVLLCVIAATVCVAISIYGVVYLKNEETERFYDPIWKGFGFLLIGFIFYITRVPERIPLLHKYEFVQLYLNSHAFWHIFVTLCNLVLYWNGFYMCVAKDIHDNKMSTEN